MADITFRCGKCGQSIEVDAKYAGQSASCPACDAPVEIPSTPIPKGPKRTARAHALAKTSALTKCPACKGQVATAADICPHCAYPVARKQAEAVARERNKAATKQLLVILIVVLIGMGSMAAVDMVHADWYLKGGITGLLKIAHLCEANGVKCQVHAGGIENLHLACAIRNTDFHEQIVPEETFHLLVKNPVLKPDEGGYISPPDRPGIGLELDRDLIEKYSYETLD